MNLWLAVALLIACAFGTGFFMIRIGLALARPITEWPIGPRLYAELLLALALLAALGVIVYRVIGALTLSYAVDRNGLYIFWLGNRAVVPLTQIERVERGAPRSDGLASRLRSLGYYHGQMRLADGRLVHRFSSLPLERSLLLHTAAASYAIAPQEGDAFVQELEQRRRLGAIQPLASGVEAGRMFFYSFWSDQVVRQALLLAVALNLAVLGWLMLIYQGLPAQIELRADAVGDLAVLRPRHQVLFLPLAGCVVLLLNVGLGLTIYAREALGARLLQIMSIVVQICFAIAVLTIVR